MDSEFALVDLKIKLRAETSQAKERKHQGYQDGTDFQHGDKVQDDLESKGHCIFELPSEKSLDTGQGSEAARSHNEDHSLSL